MAEHSGNLKHDVMEIKFLIHDLRVEKFINEVIHFHATVNTDLEIHDAEQARAFHQEDLLELKAKAVAARKALDHYMDVVKCFASDEEVLAAGRAYVQSIFDTCAFIMDPRWNNIDTHLSLLPDNSRSVRSYRHCLNCIRWISGVYYRIHYFMQEQDNDLYEKFDIASELSDFVRNVVYSYVTEKTHARVEIRLERLDEAVLGGNRHRLRRMFFNLVMNSVDAMSQKKMGVLTISALKDGDNVILRVRDNGIGMTTEKIDQLMTDRDSLDGELDALGFVFVRQTVAEFGGSLSIDSMVNQGTTVSILLPRLVGATATSQKPAEPGSDNLAHKIDKVRAEERAAYLKKTAKGGNGHDSCGETVYGDYLVSNAEFPGAIFAIAINEANEIELFSHRPYERHWNITHEDLSPMLFEATVRGRLEEEEDKTPALILKSPQSVREYFDFKEVPEEERSTEKFTAMVHDELIRICRVLTDTGMAAGIGVRVTDLNKFFPNHQDLVNQEPFPLETLARLAQHTEEAS